MPIPRSWTELNLGRALFLAGLACWAAIGASLLPFDASDLCYLLALDEGSWRVQELVHPVFVPLLGLYRGLLGAAGLQGNMLMPLAWLNLCGAAASLGILFLLAERLRRDSLPSALAVLGFAFSAAGFWVACLRPTPYSLTVLCLTASAWALAREGSFPGRLRLAGVLSGLACGLHLACVSVIVPAAFHAWPRLPERRRVRGLAAWFLGPMAGALLACYVVLFWYHGLDPRRALDMGGPGLLASVEQVPTTSLWSNLHPWTLAANYAETMRVQGGLFLGLLALALGLKAAAGELRSGLSRLRSTGALGLMAAYALSFSAFFIINNTRNGLAFAALIPLPLLLAGLAPAKPLFLAAFALLACLQGARGTAEVLAHESGKSRDPILSEASFLSSELGPADILLVPGCPFPEISYLTKTRLVPVAPPLMPADAAEFPALRCSGKPVERLDAAALSRMLESGGRALFTAGEASDPRDLDVSGDFKKRQVFMPFETSRQGQERALAAFLPLLPRSRLRKVTSPQGRVYIELMPPGAAAEEPKKR
ncbi:MAG: hypothetical protein HZB91_14780 [Elusimicrobia bacterium]|nr:hypothetical protein [Elusimicrobiota bacterium]